MSCTDIISFSPRLPGPYSWQADIHRRQPQRSPARPGLSPLNGKRGRGVAADGRQRLSQQRPARRRNGRVDRRYWFSGGATGCQLSAATAASSFTVNSDTSITATTPAGTGAVDVTVTTPCWRTSATPVPLTCTPTSAPLPQTINFTQPPPAKAGTADQLSATGGGSTSPRRLSPSSAGSGDRNHRHHRVDADVHRSVHLRHRGRTGRRCELRGRA